MRTQTVMSLAVLLALASLAPVLAQDQEPRTEVHTTETRTTTTTTTAPPVQPTKKKVVHHTRSRRRARVHHYTQHTLPAGTTIIHTTTRTSPGTRVRVHIP